MLEKTLPVGGSGLTAPRRHRLESGLQINFGVDASISRQRNNDKERMIPVSVEDVDVVHSLFEFLLTGNGDDGLRASLADVIDGKPATRGDAHSLVAESESGITQTVDGAVRVARGTLKAQLIVFRFAGVAVPQTMGQ